jgi:hypothetical protein
MGMAYKANRVIQLSKNIGSNKLWLLRLETTFHELLNNLGMLRNCIFLCPLLPTFYFTHLMPLM